MPIYDYLCNSCGAEEEHLQKMSDDPITICPACGSGDYVKRVSAPGFQLKGSGWYATDFKNKQSSPGPAAKKNTTTQKSTSTPSSK